MAYLHCHNCDWEQDDFWEVDGYNPFTCFDESWLIKKLFEDRVCGSKNMFEEMGFEPHEIFSHEEGKGYWVDSRNYVANEFRRKARRIQNMSVKTWEDWERIRKDFECPECGSDNWDID